MSQFQDDKDIFSRSNPDDFWNVDSLLDDTDVDIYSSSTPQKPVKGKKSSSKKGNEKKPLGKRIFKILVSAILVFVIAIGIGGLALVGSVVLSTPADIPYNLNNLQLQYSTLIYARENEQSNWQVAANLHGTENRVWVNYSEISPYFANAVVSIEDKRFYSHEGVDWKRTMGAFANTIVNIYGGTQGGSTITQQLVKNLTGDKEQTAKRKIQEILRALELEKEYTKATILECYINTVHFGNGCDGLETAANFYFGKEASELTLLECASLAATIQTPNAKNPIDGPESNQERREICLGIMLEEGYITQAEYDEAMADTLTVVGNEDKKQEKEEEQKKKVNSYFVDTLIEDVIADLMVAKECTYGEAEAMIYSGGFQIYSSLKPSVQEALEKTFEDETNFPKNSEGVRAQSAQTIMDYTGHIVAIAGGVGEKTEDRSLNRAYQSTRQPGSSIKPLSVYAPGIEYNKLTYSSHIYDFHLKLANGSYYPKAAGSGKYVTTQKAIQSSLNSTAVRVCNDLTPAKSYEFLKKRFGITTLVESEKMDDGRIVSDVNLSALALGGMAHGVTVTEMTAAYATFGNLGMYYQPSTYYAVYDSFGELVLSHQEVGAQVITPETSNVMNRLMQTVITQGTGGAASLSGWSVFGKTGTTDNKHDCWFAGGTPYYVSAVWCGYDTDHDLPGGANPAPGIWKKTMVNVMEELEKCDFNQSGSVVCYKYCTESGGIATSDCKDTQTGYYKVGYTPKCTLHDGVMVKSGNQAKPRGGVFADIKQDPLPEADAYRLQVEEEEQEEKAE